jgi:hypothetical protein
LPAIEATDRHGVDLPPRPGEDVACAMEHRAPSGKGRSRGKGGMSEPSPDLATTCRESAPAATLHLLPRGGGRRPPNNRTIIHAPGAGRQLQNRPPPSRSRHRDIEGEGEWPSNTRTGRHARGVGVSRQCQIQPLSRCFHRQTPSIPRRHGTPFQPGRPPREGWMMARCRPPQ